MKLELVPVPVTNVERAKEFYERAGFDLNVDVEPDLVVSDMDAARADRQTFVLPFFFTVFRFAVAYHA